MDLVRWLRFNVQTHRKCLLSYSPDVGLLCIGATNMARSAVCFGPHQSLTDRFHTSVLTNPNRFGVKTHSQWFLRVCVVCMRCRDMKSSCVCVKSAWETLLCSRSSSILWVLFSPFSPENTEVAAGAKTSWTSPQIHFYSKKVRGCERTTAVTVTEEWFNSPGRGLWKLQLQRRPCG